MPATVYDVARHANVSIATVSRVINARGNVSEKTAETVRKSITALNFSPNVSAKSLMDRQTGTVGLLLPEMHGAFFSEVVKSMDAVAQAHEQHLLISCSHDTTKGMAAGLAAMRGRVDGVVMMSPLISTKTIEKIAPDDMPVVILNGDGRRTDRFKSVGLDNRFGGQLMAEHFVAQGFRRIAVIMGPGDNREAKDRRRGVEDILREHAIADLLTIHDGDFTEDSGFECGQAIARSEPLPDAVFALNDAMAIGCLSAFAEHGLHVPEDIALAGFDDIPLSRYVQPSLTTIAVPIEDLVRTSFDALLPQLGGGEKTGSDARTQLRPELRQRASTSR